MVYVVDHGWHTDIAVPSAELSGGAARFRALFPGAPALLFGFGKRTFLTARVDRWEEYLLGPFPGPGAMLVIGLAVAPDRAFPPGDVVVLPVPAGGLAALSDFLWAQFDRDRAGGPRLIARGPSPGSLFYAARERYGLWNTCNTWTAEALQRAGLAVRPDGVVFAAQAMARARRAALCPLPP